MRTSIRNLLLASNRFSPLAIPGLILWLKADAGRFQDVAGTTPAVADADPVGLWRDQSGQGNNASQSTASARPTLKLAIQNGLPIIRFDGVDDRLEIASGTPFLVDATHNITWLFALKIANSSGVVSAGTTGPNYSNAEHYGWADSTSWSTHSGNGGSTPALTRSLTAGTYHVVSLQATGGNTWQFWADGSSRGTTTIASYLTPVSVALGSTGVASSTDLCEVLCYTGALSNANRQSVESYLKRRWGTP